MSKSFEVGFVKSVRDFLVYVDGLPSVKINEIVETEDGIRGIVHALLEEEVELLLLDEGNIKPRQIFKRLGKKLGIPVGNFLLGRAINALGVPIDGKGLLIKNPSTPNSDIDKVAPGIAGREFINSQFITGVGLVDTLIPIGKGQRELVIGDARSGKTSFLIDTISNQTNSGVICIYASIGKPAVEVRVLYDALGKNGSLKHTCLIAASSSDPAPLIYITPRVAFSIAEFFQAQGKDVLLILDDMGNHAKIYREISLLGNRSPGRESYPGDIFYQHAFLVERAGNFTENFGGGSITCLPVIELDLNDFTTFIPTNLMGMTDGHLLFRSSLHNQGFRPAIDISLSVSRVGQQTQQRIQNLLATRIKQVLAQASTLDTVKRFSFELPATSRSILIQKELIDELLKQNTYQYLPIEIQTVLLALPFTTFMEDKTAEFAQIQKINIIASLSKNPQLLSITQNVFSFSSDQELINQLEGSKAIFQQVTNEGARP